MNLLTARYIGWLLALPEYVVWNMSQNQTKLYSFLIDKMVKNNQHHLSKL